MPQESTSVTAWATVSSASRCCRRPRHRLTFAAQPSPSISAAAFARITVGNATLTAAVAVMPTPCPTKIWSTRLYRQLTISVMAVGTA